MWTPTCGREKQNYFTPLLTKRIIYKMLEELALCYNYRREDQKAEEIQQLMRLLTDDEPEELK